MTEEIKGYVVSRLFNNILFVVDQHGHCKLYIFFNLYQDPIDLENIVIASDHSSSNASESDKESSSHCSRCDEDQFMEKFLVKEIEVDPK